MLKPMQRDSSLRERAAVALRASIVTGEIRPGEIYSAPMIAQQLGVSATPVREAMLDLASEGLVEPVRNRGLRVIQLTERDLDEIFQVRLLLEVPTVVAVAGDNTLLTDKLVKCLNRLIEVLEASAGAGDFGGLIDADIKFHSELLALPGNERLVDSSLVSAPRRFATGCRASSATFSSRPRLTTYACSMRCSRATRRTSVGSWRSTSR
jgi:DNA-binding GntR family transcriptional regulator